MLEILNNEKGPFQVLFGDDASVDPNIVFPIVSIIIVALLIIAVRVALNSRGKSELTEEELEADQAFFDAQMEKQAAFAGETYEPEKARENDEMEMKIARGELDRYGNPV
jgi:septal ring-binding cell division protein DamX